MEIQNQYKIVLQQSRNLCSRSEKCTNDIRQYLSKKDVSEDDIEKIINTLIEEMYIDESRYAEFFVNDKLKFNKWGKVKIRHVLRQKQINNSIINDALQNIDDDNYKKILVSVMKQKCSSLQNRDNIKAKASLIRFMSGRGFEHELIMNSIEVVMNTK